MLTRMKHTETHCETTGLFVPKILKTWWNECQVTPEVIYIWSRLPTPPHPPPPKVMVCLGDNMMRGTSPSPPVGRGAWTMMMDDGDNMRGTSPLWEGGVGSLDDDDGWWGDVGWWNDEWWVDDWWMDDGWMMGDVGWWNSPSPLWEGGVVVVVLEVCICMYVYVNVNVYACVYVFEYVVLEVLVLRSNYVVLRSKYLVLRRTTLYYGLLVLVVL